MLLVSGFFILLGEHAYSQTDTEFWFAAPEINQTHSDRPIFLRMTSNNLATVVTINQPANPAFPVLTYSLAPFTTQSVDLTQYIDIIECKPNNSVLNYGIHIKATQAITAYYEVVSAVVNPEIFSLKGRNALGTEFLTPFQNFAISYPEYQNGFVIVATISNTSVTITPSKDAIGHPAGIPFTITLNKGQTFALVAVSNLTSGRLGGSSVISDKPIAITVYDDSVDGSFWTSYCLDLCGDQIIPVPVTGMEYIVTRGWLTNGIEKVFIVATENNTDIFVEGGSVPVATINTGETYTYTLNTNSLYVNASKPIYLCHLSGFGGELGMPILPPINCTGSRSLGFTRSNGQFFGIILLVKNGHQGDFVLNGSTTTISPSDFSVVPGTGGDWVAARKTLPTCPVGTGSRISNTTALFHLGIFNGDNSSGCRYGYFSDFSNLYLGADILKCPNDTVILDAGYGKFSYLWNTGDTSQTLSVVNPGTYWVVADNGDCFVSDTILISNNYLPVLNLGADTALCFGNSVQISTGNIFPNYIWSTGETTPQIYVNSSNVYSVTVSDEICSDSASKKIIFLNASIINGDTLICEGDSINLTATASGGEIENVSYLWSNGDTTAVTYVTPSTTTIYSVTVTCLGVECVDQVIVTVSDGAFSLGPDTSVCTGNTITISGPSGVQSYLWSNNSTTQTISPVNTGRYWLEAVSADGCHFRDTIDIIYHPLPLDVGQEICPSRNGLVAWYPFNNNVKDTGTFFNNGVPNGLAFTADRFGISGKASDFNGNAYISVENSASLESPQEEISIMGWVRINDLSGGKGSILCKTDEQSLSPYQYRIGFQPGSAYFGYKNSVSTVSDIQTSYTIPVNQWLFAGVTYDGQIVKYYIGDDLIGQLAVPGSIFQDNKGLEIGRDAYGTNEYFSGAMDDIRIYKRSMCNYELSLISRPRIMSLSGGAATVCSGDSVSISLNYPQPGISYQMYSYPGNIAFGTAQITYCDSVMNFSTGALNASTQFKILAVDTATGCQRWLTNLLSITVSPSPEVSINPSNPSICFGDSIALTANSNLGSTGFNWSTGANSATIIVIPVSDSTFKVTGMVNGCIDSTEVSVQVKPTPVVTVLPGDTSICSNESILLTAISSLPSSSYLWSNGNINQAVLVSPSETTLYTVTASLNGCSDTAQLRISVIPKPEIGFAPAYPEACYGDSVNLIAYCNLLNPSFQWANGPASSSYKVLAQQNSFYTVQCTVDVCSSIDSVYLTVNPDPVIVINPANPSVCLGDEITLQAMSNLPGTSFTWGSGQTGSSLSVSPLMNTIYYVSGVINNCSGHDTVMVVVKPVPIAIISPSDTTICSGDSYTLNGYSSIAGSQYFWNTGQSQSQIVVAPQVSTTYNLVVNANNCRDTAYTSVNILAIPDIDLGPDKYLCYGQTELLSVTAGYSGYLWSDGSQMNYLNIYKTGTYWVVVRNLDCPASDTITFLECSEIWIPNAFTPDDNGINDIFLPKGVNIFEYEMLIFNRWGERLFTSHDINFGWDGVFKGEPAKCDVYYYLIQYKIVGKPGSDKRQIKHGPFTLIR